MHVTTIRVALTAIGGAIYALCVFRLIGHYGHLSDDKSEFRDVEKSRRSPLASRSKWRSTEFR